LDLRKYIEQIKQLEPMTTGFMYKPHKWNKLSPNHRSLIQDFEGKTITRADVIKAYEKYYQDGTDVMIPFLLTMVWGFADTGYGTHRTNNYISNPENIDLIKQGIDAAQGNNFKTAFKALKQIEGLGVSYLTKVLYFATKGAGIKNYALIYDIRVASSLIQLSTPTEIFEIVSVSPSSKYENFVKYNTLVHALGSKYQVEADAIELFLFDQKFY
jgi:hypothetical protein